MKLFKLLKGITSKQVGDFYCLNCFHSYTTENKLKQHENVCRNYDYCYVEMPKEDSKILKYNLGEKSMKVPFVIYADLESLFEKISTCRNNPEKSSTTKINKHTASGYSLFTYCSFGNTKNMLDYYRGQDCRKRFCKDLKSHAEKIINCKKKEMIPLTHLENDSYENQKVCHVCKKDFNFDIDSCGENMYIKYLKVKDHCHYTGKY